MALIRTWLITFLFLIFIGTAACKKPMEVEKEWIRKGPEGGSIASIVIDPATTSTLYIGTWGGGIFKSTDGGENWTDITESLGSNRKFLTKIDDKNRKKAWIDKTK